MKISKQILAGISVFAILATLSLTGLTVAFAGETWDKTKEVSGDTWDKTKEVSSETWDKTKEVSSETWDKGKGKIHDATAPKPGDSAKE